VPGSLRRSIVRERARLRNEGRAALFWSLRVTVASVASYVAATELSSGPPPLLAPLTAMLVVQVTPLSLLASGVDRVVSVVVGVAIAVVFAALLPLTWWTLGVLIFLSITLGQVLRLRANLMEVPISAMLVLGVGSLAAQSAAGQRIGETLVGAAVGVATNLLVPPKVGTAAAGRAIDQVADSVSELLNRAAADLERIVDEGGDVARESHSWLGEARRITHDVPQAGAALLHAERGRRLNVRAVWKPNAGPGLRQGLEALEHSAVAIRGMFRAVEDATSDSAWSAADWSDVLLGLALTWREMAAALDAFGQLVSDEAASVDDKRPVDVDVVRDALQGLLEGRTRLEEWVTADVPGPRLDLAVAVLGAVKRLLQELDLDQRLRRQIRLARTAPRRVPRSVPRRRTDPGRDVSASPDAETQVLGRIPDEP
jgi:hypothetical protein